MPTPDSKESIIILTFSPELERQANSKYRNFILKICYPGEYSLWTFNVYSLNLLLYIVKLVYEILGT